MSFWEYVHNRQELLWFETYQHASMVLQCLLLATAIGLIVAVITYRSKTASAVATGIASVLFTVPSFALFGLLIPVFGLGTTPAVIALVLYALLPIVRNSVVGMSNVDPNLVDAARGMGMNRVAVLVKVELPLAWPVILTGIRVSAQLVLGVAAIAAYVSGPGLGEQIFSGLSRLGGANSVNSAVAGTVAIVILALIFDAAFVLIGRFTTSRGIRG
ncbi:MAG: ABC transporter permease [Actinocatenispora sp.]